MRSFPTRSFRLLLVIGLLLQVVSPALANSGIEGRLSQMRLPNLLTPTVAVSNSYFRAELTIRNESDWRKLADLEVEILDRFADRASVIVNQSQLETLARLQFQPRHINELSHLVQVNASEQPMLARSLQPMLEAVAAAENTRSEEMPSFQNLAFLDDTQRNGLRQLPDADGDSDGLSDTEESWWCTDPHIADTDSDGNEDGAEIERLKAWFYNEVTTPPVDTPWANWPPALPSCNDSDFDSVPDLAEISLGLDENLESTDRDRFDDGQELFGITYCPGSGSACGYGVLPSASHDGILLFPQMPAWVEWPSNHPIIPAFPKLEIDIVPDGEGNTFKMQTVTVVTTDHVIEEGETKSYSTTKTEGTSTANTETETWENWQEISRTDEAESASGRANFYNTNAQIMQTTNVRTTNVSQSYNDLSSSITNIYRTTPQGYLGEKAAEVGDFVIDEACAEIGCKKYGGSAVRATIRTGIEFYRSSDTLQNTYRSNNCSLTGTSLKDIGCRFKSIGTLWKNTFNDRMDAATAAEQEARGQTVGQVYSEADGQLNMQRAFPVSFPMPRFVPTITSTSGSSRGGSRSTTHTRYEEHSITEGTTNSFSESWGTATAEDSSHAADLWFAYSIANVGGDYARQICDLSFNVYIGNDPIPAATYFPGSDLGGDGCLSNFRPGENHVYSFPSQSRIALTLDQMKAVDEGAAIRIIVEDYTLGQDDFYADDAISDGVIVSIDDGIEDGNEEIDTFILPLADGDSLYTAMRRFFEFDEDENEFVTAIWTPEQRSTIPNWCREPRLAESGSKAVVWCKHELSTAQWWNVYSTDSSSVGGFQELAVNGGSVVLLRFNSDTDLDGYSDRTEERFGTNKDDPASHPMPELLAGIHSTQNGNNVVATLSLLNSGNYDAYGIEAVMIAPNDTISITNNTVGGAGRVGAFQSVVVGSEISEPILQSQSWQGDAIPFTDGYYINSTERVYTATVNCPVTTCEIGSGEWTLEWTDSAENSGAISFGDGYESPSVLSVGDDGVQFGFISGEVRDGDHFVVQAMPPSDTFQYTINHEPHTPPIILVTYNDPQGRHRIAIPIEAMQLQEPNEDLAQFAGAMLEGVDMRIATERPANAEENPTNIIVQNSMETPIEHSYFTLEFVTASADVAATVIITEDVPIGPSIRQMAWETPVFSPTFNLEDDYLILAFWTDYQGNIIDTVGRPLSSFHIDPKEELVMGGLDTARGSLTWDFGTVTRGEIVRETLTLANVGHAPLRTYLDGAAELSIVNGNHGFVNVSDALPLTLELDTSDVVTGAYAATATLRTSDSDEPLTQVQVTGNVVALTDAAVARSILNRPLDISLWITGSHNAGEWIQFTHSLGSDTQTIHPVYVNDTTGNLLGVGEYATSFGEGTSSTAMFGDGRDGVMPSTGNLDYANGFGFGVVDGSIGSTSVSVIDQYGVTRIKSGDVVLLHQTQGNGAGNWELNRAISDFAGTGTYILEKPLEHDYSYNGSNNDRAQILRVPQYSTCNVTGTITPLAAWNGYWGGIFAVMCQGQMNVSGQVTSNGMGFRGGGRPPSDGDHGSGMQGEGHLGIGGRSRSANGCAGGGGGGDHVGSNRGGAGGGGGGHRTNGANGSSGANGIPHGIGGTTVGSADMSQIFFGCGGGGGGPDDNDTNTGAGGKGGGIVVLMAREINVAEVVSSNGTNAGSGSSASGGGGGGSGGTVLLMGKTVSVGNDLIYANGGVRGSASGDGGWGGNGALGRMKLAACEPISGHTNQPREDITLICHAVEQVEGNPTHTRLNLPEATTGGELLTVQYGHLVELASAGEQTVRLRLPDAAFAGATLDALVSGQSGSFALKLDIGNDGSWDWQTSGDGQPQTLNSPDLAAAFNAYRAAQGRSAGETLDVPVRVSLDTGGQVLLTNLVVEPVAAGEVAPTLSDFGTVTEGESVTLEATIDNNDSDPITGAMVSFHTTLPDGQNWYIGSAFLPTIPANGNATATYEWNTLGFTGTLPITATVDPYNRIVETVEDDNAASATVTVLARPDLALAEVNVGTARQGLASSVAVTVRNSGGVVAEDVQVTLGDGGASRSVFDQQSVTVPANGEVTAVLTWMPAARGSTDLHLQIDSNDQFDERNETDNLWSSTVAVGWGNPFVIDVTGANDQAYNATDGYGYLAAGNTQNCGDGSSEQTYREGTGGNPIEYRFDHLLPDRFYHLDMTFFRCGSARDMQVSVDGVVGIESVTAGTVPQTVSLLLRPSDYADGNVVVAIDRTGSGFGQAAISELYLTDIRYCDRDSGLPVQDPAYTDAPDGCGHLNGEIANFWGNERHQTVRYTDSGPVLYRFDGLEMGKRYQLHVTLYDGDDDGRQQSIAVDGEVLASGIALSSIPIVQTVDVPINSYADGVIDVAIENAGSAETVVSGIVLEQVTPDENAVPLAVLVRSVGLSHPQLVLPILIFVLGLGIVIMLVRRKNGSV